MFRSDIQLAVINMQQIAYTYKHTRLQEIILIDDIIDMHAIDIHQRNITAREWRKSQRAAPSFARSGGVLSWHSPNRFLALGNASVLHPITEISIHHNHTAKIRGCVTHMTKPCQN